MAQATLKDCRNENVFNLGNVLSVNRFSHPYNPKKKEYDRVNTNFDNGYKLSQILDIDYSINLIEIIKPYLTKQVSVLENGIKCDADKLDRMKSSKDDFSNLITTTKNDIKKKRGLIIKIKNVI